MNSRSIAHYRLLERLGSGASGVVYRAVDTHLNRSVALKLLTVSIDQQPDARRRFAQEALAAASLQHPNLCTIHDLGETEDGQLYIAMALYEGGTLADRLQSGPLPPAATLPVVGHVAAGLACAHSAGIVHRDLKPANILFDQEGRAVVVDFGLARLAASEALTESGALLGTLFYMAPEQVQGQSAVPASDVWSLGVLWHEMLTGVTPFRAPTAAGVLSAITRLDPGTPASLAGTTLLPIAELLQQCLAKDPDQRPAAGVVRDRLRSGPPQAEEAATVKLRRARPRSRAMRPALTVLLFVLALSLVLAMLPWPDHWFGSPPPEPGIVLLPPVVLGGDDRDQALARGLIQHLTGWLNLIEPGQDRAWVMPAVDVRQNAVTGIEAAAARLGAGTVIATSLQRHGDMLRLELVRHEVHLSSGPEIRSAAGRLDDLVG